MSGFILVLTLIVFMVASTLQPYDDTDNAGGGERSGMALYTDHGTGCQYLGNGFWPRGGLTPRLDGRGNHVGCYD